mmetsp:Transcript_31839/g.52485  ORF Transcript_31839/g.52485 Transcript_31839/m.52485 type:complete len:189 (-) Transcript_31839:77-643(-)|eukprot:CAMPEP_0119013914 /NCGR_PEP_ID=MMETSP1176-20130426/9228_1 /TAXON_ID=265551 /ORGANISM="Synedropsis recta cf, Strain CCMP1620" /LENGTH=188 /DNA_ID=CAMNT_0006967041 /DNA_START=60 /DNA_END=626 /DNA_ORIENTATION=+
MKTVIFASLLASAVAFAPATTKSASSTSLRAADLSKEIGAMAPLGFFDPLNVACDKPVFDELRYVELKHGRVAMLAVVGYLVTKAGARFPGCENVGSGFAALKELPMAGYLMVAFSIAILEIVNRDATGDSEFMGDFRNGFDFGWDKQTDEWKKKKRTIELNQGRAAQMGILGLMVHDGMGNLDTILP